jgi:hypothetical protein
MKRARLISYPEYELNSNPKVTVILVSSVGNASRHNDGSSISSPLHQANDQGIDERDDHGNDRSNNHENDNTEDVGDTTAATQIRQYWRQVLIS